MDAIILDLTLDSDEEGPPADVQQSQAETPTAKSRQGGLQTPAAYGTHNDSIRTTSSHYPTNVPGASPHWQERTNRGRNEAPVAQCGVPWPAAGNLRTSAAEAAYGPAPLHVMPRTGPPALQGEQPGRDLKLGVQHGTGGGSNLACEPSVSASLAGLGRMGHIVSQPSMEQFSADNTARRINSQLPEEVSRPESSMTVGERNLLAAMGKLTSADPAGNAQRLVTPASGAVPGLASLVGGPGQHSAAPAQGFTQGLALPFSAVDQPRSTHATQGFAGSFFPGNQQQSMGAAQGCVLPFPLPDPHISALGLWRPSNLTAVAPGGNSMGAWVRSPQHHPGMPPSSSMQNGANGPQRHGGSMPVGSAAYALQDLLRMRPSSSVQRPTSSPQRPATSFMQASAGPMSPAFGSGGVGAHASTGNPMGSNMIWAALDRLQAATSPNLPPNPMPSVPAHTLNSPLPTSPIFPQGSICLAGGHVYRMPATQGNAHFADNPASFIAAASSAAHGNLGTASQVQHTQMSAGSGRPSESGVYTCVGPSGFPTVNRGEPASTALAGGGLTHGAGPPPASMSGMAARGPAHVALPAAQSHQAYLAAIQLEAMAFAHATRMGLSKEAVVDCLKRFENHRWRYGWMLSLILFFAGPNGCLAAEVPLRGKQYGMEMREIPTSLINKHFPGATASTAHFRHPLYVQAALGSGAAAKPPTPPSAAAKPPTPPSAAMKPPTPPSAAAKPPTPPSFSQTSAPPTIPRLPIAQPASAPPSTPPRVATVGSGAEHRADASYRELAQPAIASRSLVQPITPTASGGWQLGDAGARVEGQAAIPPLPHGSVAGQAAMPPLPCARAVGQAAIPPLPHGRVEGQAAMPPLPCARVEGQAAILPLPHGRVEGQAPIPPLPHGRVVGQAAIPPLPCTMVAGQAATPLLPPSMVGGQAAIPHLPHGRVEGQPALPPLPHGLPSLSVAQILARGASAVTVQSTFPQSMSTDFCGPKPLVSPGHTPAEVIEVSDSDDDGRNVEAPNAVLPHQGPQDGRNVEAPNAALSHHGLQDGRHVDVPNVALSLQGQPVGRNVNVPNVALSLRGQPDAPGCCPASPPCPATAFPKAGAPQGSNNLTEQTQGGTRTMPCGTAQPPLGGSGASGGMTPPAGPKTQSHLGKKSPLVDTTADDVNTIITVALGPLQARRPSWLKGTRDESSSGLGGPQKPAGTRRSPDRLPATEGRREPAAESSPGRASPPSLPVVVPRESSPKTVDRQPIPHAAELARPGAVSSHCAEPRQAAGEAGRSAEAGLAGVEQVEHPGLHSGLSPSPFGEAALQNGPSLLRAGSVGNAPEPRLSAHGSSAVQLTTVGRETPAPGPQGCQADVERSTSPGQASSAPEPGQSMLPEEYATAVPGVQAQSLSNPEVPHFVKRVQGAPAGRQADATPTTATEQAGDKHTGSSRAAPEPAQPPRPQEDAGAVSGWQSLSSSDQQVDQSLQGTHTANAPAESSAPDGEKRSSTAVRPDDADGKVSKAGKKFCASCKQWKDAATDFYRDITRKDKLEIRCKACHMAATRGLQKRRKEAKEGQQHLEGPMIRSPLDAAQRPLADEMQLLPGVGAPGSQPVNTVEKAFGNLTAVDLVKLRKRGVAQPPQPGPRDGSPAPLAGRKSQTADHVQSSRQMKVAQLCSTLLNQEFPAGVPPRPDPYRERYPCGSQPAGPTQSKPLRSSHSGDSPQVTTTSGSGDAASEPALGREDGSLRQNPSVTSVARVPSLEEGQIAPGLEPRGPGEGRPSAGGPGPCGAETSVSNPDAQTDATALANHSGHGHTSAAKEITPVGPKAVRLASQNLKAPVALKAPAPVSWALFGSMAKAAAGISDVHAKPERRPPPPEDVIRKAEPVTGRRYKTSKAQANPSPSVSLPKHGSGAGGVSTGRGPALVGTEVPGSGAGEPPGRAAPSRQPLPSDKDGRGPGEGGAELTGAELTGAKEGPDSVAAGSNQKLEHAGVAGAIHTKASHDLTACSGPQASGSQGAATGNPKRGPAPKRKAGEREDGLPKVLAPRGGGVAKKGSALTQGFDRNADPSKANRLRRNTPTPSPTISAPRVPAEAEGAGRITHAHSLPLPRVAKGKAADEGPSIAGWETASPAISAEREGAGPALDGIAADRPLVGVWGQRRSRQITRRRSDPSGGVPCIERTSADGARASPRSGMEPPGRRLTVKIGDRRFGEASASGEDSSSGVPCVERTSADGAGASPRLGVEPPRRRLTVKIGDRRCGEASASGEDSPSGVPCGERRSADGASASPRLGAEPPKRRLTVKIGNRRFVGPSASGEESPSSVSAPLSAKPRCLPSRFSRELNALLSTPLQPDKGVPAEGQAKPAGTRSQKGLKQCSQPLAEALEASENATSTQVRGSGLGVANPPAESQRDQGTAEGGAARAAERSADGKGDSAPCEEVEQELPAAMPRPKLRRLRKASELVRFNQPDQVHVTGAEAPQEDSKDMNRHQEVPGPGVGTSGGRDAPGSPDREASNNEADVPSPQAATQSYYEPSEEVPLTYEVFDRLYVTRGYITMLTRTLRSEVEETFLKAVKGRFVRRREGNVTPQYWLRLVVDAKWPLPSRQTKEERVKPVLILEDGSHQTLEGLSDEPARNVWALPEVAVLWHRTQSRGRGLPDTAIPLTSAAVETACFRSQIYVNLAAIKRVKDKDLKERHMRTLGRFLKDRAQPPQQLLQECRIPHPPLRYNEEAEALSAKFNSVLAPRMWQPSRSPSLDRDGGAESPFGFYSPEPDSPEGKIVAAPVAKPVPAHPTGLMPTPASTPGQQGQEARPAKTDLRADGSAQTEKKVRAAEGKVKLESPVDAIGRELARNGASAREDLTRVNDTGQSIGLPNVPGQSHGLEKDVGNQSPLLEHRLSMEDPILLGSLAKLSLNSPPLFPVDHGMCDVARPHMDREKTKRKWDEGPVDHAMHDKAHTPLDRDVAKREGEMLPKRQGRDGAQGLSLLQGNELAEGRDRRACGRGPPPSKRMRRTPVGDVSLPRRSPSASSRSRDRAPRRHYSAERDRRRSGSSETPRGHKQRRKERRRSRSRGRQHPRSRSPETYARQQQQKSRDARHVGIGFPMSFPMSFPRKPHKQQGFRKPGRDGERARPRSAGRERDSRGTRPSSFDGWQKAGRDDGDRRERSSSREPHRGRTGRDLAGGWSKPKDNRRRSMSLSRERYRRDRARGRRSGDRELSSHSRGSHSSEAGPVKQRSPPKSSPPVTDLSVDMSIDEDIPASCPTSQQGQDGGKAIQDAATSGANTLSAHGEQAELPPPPPLPASALRPPPLLVNVPPDLWGIGATVTATPEGRTQNRAHPADAQPTPSTSVGTEARQVSANEAPHLSLADKGNTVAPDPGSGTATAPPIQVGDNVKICPPLNPSGGQSNGPADPIRQGPSPPWHNPVSGGAPSLPVAPISGAEQSPAGAPCAEAGAQPGGAVPKPPVAENGSTQPACGPLSKLPPWHRPATTGGPPAPDVAAAAAADAQNAGGAAQVSLWQQRPDGSAPWPAGPVSAGEGYLLPSGNAAWNTTGYSYGNQYGYAPRPTPPSQGHAYSPAHAHPYAAPPYPGHPYLHTGEHLGYPYYHGHGYPTPQQYAPSAYSGAAGSYSAAPYAVAAHPQGGFDPSRRAPVPGPRRPPGEQLLPTLTNAAAASAGLAVVKDEPTLSGKVGVTAGDADAGQNADPPGIPRPQTLDQDLTTLALVPVRNVDASNAQLVRTAARRVVRRVVPGTEAQADPVVPAMPSDASRPTSRQLALPAAPVAPTQGAAHSAALLDSVLKQLQAPGFCKLSENIALMLLKGYQTPKWKTDALSVESLVELSKKPENVQEDIVKEMFSKVMQTRNSVKVKDMYLLMAMGKFRNT